MPYTSVSKSDKNRFGLKSHAVPMIIAIAYLVDSIEAEMTLLRGITLILAACYIVTMCVAIIQSLRDKAATKRAAVNDDSERENGVEADVKKAEK